MSRRGEKRWIKFCERIDPERRPIAAFVSTAVNEISSLWPTKSQDNSQRIFREKASGKDTGGRPQLEEAIDTNGKGDILVVAEWDRATRSMMDGVRLIERIGALGAMIRVLDKPDLDLTTPIGRGLPTVGAPALRLRACSHYCGTRPRGPSSAARSCSWR